MKTQVRASLAGPGKKTTVAVGSKMSESTVPDWDKNPGHGQHRARADARAAMGQKKTPLTATKLR